MLNKKEVTAWVERQEVAAIEAAESLYLRCRNMEEERLMLECGVLDQLEIMRKLVIQLDAENVRLCDLLDGAQDISYEKHGFCGLSNRIEDIKELRKLVWKYAKFESPKILQLAKNKDETLHNIRTNYAAVYAELKNKKNAAHCLSYLKELGFDVSGLERLEHTEVAVAVDRRYLFINGGNQDGINEDK